MTKGELNELNTVWEGAKAICSKMERDTIGTYLYTKTKVSDAVKKLGEEIQSARKLVLSEMGVEEGVEIPKDKLELVQVRLESVFQRILTEEVEIDTNILTQDEFYDAILLVDDNKGISTGGQALLLKYLVKRCA